MDTLRENGANVRYRLGPAPRGTIAGRGARTSRSTSSSPRNAAPASSSVDRRGGCGSAPLLQRLARVAQKDVLSVGSATVTAVTCPASDAISAATRCASGAAKRTLLPTTQKPVPGGRIAATPRSAAASSSAARRVAADLGLELLRCRQRHDAAAMQEREPVAAVGLLHEVRGEHDGGAAARSRSSFSQKARRRPGSRPVEGSSSSSRRPWSAARASSTRREAARERLHALAAPLGEPEAASARSAAARAEGRGMA